MTATYAASAQPRGEHAVGSAGRWLRSAAGLRSCAALGPLAHGAGVRNFVDPSGVRRCSGPLQRNKVWGYRSRHEACATDHHGVQKNTAAAPAAAVSEVAGFRVALNRLGSFLRGLGCRPALGCRSSAQKAAKATGEKRLGRPNGRVGRLTGRMSSFGMENTKEKRERAENLTTMD